MRNRIKTVDNVKSLKFDFGSLAGFGPPPGQNQDGKSFATSGLFQSISQKILRKNLGNGARKLLDRANERLAKILNSNVRGVKL